MPVKGEPPSQRQRRQLRPPDRHDETRFTTRRRHGVPQVADLDEAVLGRGPEVARQRIEEREAEVLEGEGSCLPGAGDPLKALGQEERDLEVLLIVPGIQLFCPLPSHTGEVVERRHP